MVSLGNIKQHLRPHQARVLPLLSATVHSHVLGKVWAHQWDIFDTPFQGKEVFVLLSTYYISESDCNAALMS